MPTIRADDGAALWTASGGRGVHLALAHGGPGLWDYLEPLAGLLEPLATVHRWDQRGNGRSERRGPFTVPRLVADMEAIRVAAGVDRWVSGGHSWGASLALAYAARYPERTLGVLYLAGVGLDWPQWVGRFREEQRSRLRALGVIDRGELARLPGSEADRLRWTTDFKDPETAEAPVGAMISSGFVPNAEANRAAQRDFEERVPQLLPALRGFDRPVLLVSGRHDPRPIQAVDSLREALSAAPVTRVVLDAGHFPWVEAETPAVEAIAAWLAALPH